MTDWPIDTEALVDELSPTGAIAEVFPRRLADSNTGVTLTSGRLHLAAIRLPAGLLVTNITFLLGTTAMVTPTNQWFALLDSDLNFLDKTADDTTTAWATQAIKTLALATPFRTFYAGLYYVGIMIAAATTPTIVGKTGTFAGNTLVPKLNGSSTTGLTTPASATSPATAISATSATPYAYLS